MDRVRKPVNMEDRYLRLLLDAIKICSNYQPRLGGNEPASLERFLQIYSTDAFYHWVGLDAQQVYKAHRAGGGLTSLYRQLGIGCQRLFQQILKDFLGLSEEQIRWRYEVQHNSGRSAFIELDARIQLDAIQDISARERCATWIQQAALKLQDVDTNRLQGAIFEVRQGYKSRDSKRQNADLQSAARAYAAGYMPVMLILSEQIDDSVAQRYLGAKWLVLRGSIEGDATTSTYAFCRTVIGFDLASFLEQHSPILRAKVQQILEVLLGDEEVIAAE